MLYKRTTITGNVMTTDIWYETNLHNEELATITTHRAIHETDHHAIVESAVDTLMLKLDICPLCLTYCGHGECKDCSEERDALRAEGIAVKEDRW
jgi:hypothetical protein